MMFSIYDLMDIIKDEDFIVVCDYKFNTIIFTGYLGELYNIKDRDKLYYYVVSYNFNSIYHYHYILASRINIELEDE